MKFLVYMYWLFNNFADKFLANVCDNVHVMFIEPELLAREN